MKFKKERADIIKMQSNIKIKQKINVMENVNLQNNIGRIDTSENSSNLVNYYLFIKLFCCITKVTIFFTIVSYIVSKNKIINFYWSKLEITLRYVIK